MKLLNNERKEGFEDYVLGISLIEQDNYYIAKETQDNAIEFVRAVYKSYQPKKFTIWFKKK